MPFNNSDISGDTLMLPVPRQEMRVNFGVTRCQKVTPYIETSLSDQAMNRLNSWFQVTKFRLSEKVPLSSSLHLPNLPVEVLLLDTFKKDVVVTSTSDGRHLILQFKFAHTKCDQIYEVSRDSSIFVYILMSTL